ncbi:hypothetical protein CSOJ01_01633 [Colletotrichum sojae]|uniref:Uncharacterized protein n=1 Tax=Colletotrichum sojae TaxID=2175907 RepID=A0A8H6JUB0_9PEZI|nr:hypothetical protein CSOJ01_01633 [Colletotrichum sojae]
MALLARLSFFLLGLLFLGQTASAATCTLKKTRNHMMPFPREVVRVEIKTDSGVDSAQVSDLCGALWKGVSTFEDACRIFDMGLACAQEVEGGLTWGFTAAGSCGGEIVEGVWRKATEGRVGDVKFNMLAVMSIYVIPVLVAQANGH